MEVNGKTKAERAKVLETVTFTLPDDDKAKEEYPNLYDLLVPRWKDGAVTREEGRMSIKPDGSGWRVSIECPTEGLAASFIVKSLITAFEEAEAHVSGSHCHWGLTWAVKKKNLQKLDRAVQ